ncbi:hypothetical protein [Breoghania sp. JC706]|uniref:hypothetical protein n=1 Tax=Breoghania sp. JC706 TaxID=3117732 RepID=UPI00300B2A1F
MSKEDSSSKRPTAVMIGCGAAYCGTGVLFDAKGQNLVVDGFNGYENNVDFDIKNAGDIHASHINIKKSEENNRNYRKKYIRGWRPSD